MEPESHHPEPFTQAVGHAAQRTAQLASIVATAAQAYAWYRARREHEHAAEDEQATRRARDQQRAAQQQGRLGWAPALDQQWLRHADLLETARAWGAAAPFGDADPAAASAIRRCEERLRHLHPYAMAYYDRLRGEGLDPIDAMREAVPLFARAPRVRTGEPGTKRAALPAFMPSPAGSSGDNPPEPTPGEGRDDPAERRGQQIIERLQERARASGRPELQPDELAVVLETVTNLPEHTIVGLIAVNAPTPAERTAAEMAAESFPFTVSETVADVRASGRGSISRSPVRPRAAAQTKAPGRTV